MIKKFTLLFIAFTFVLCAASCGDKNPADESLPEGMSWAQNEVVDYAFYYPSDWEIDRNDGMISILGGGNNISVERVSISVMAFNLSNPTMSAVEFWEEHRKSYDSTFKDMEVEKGEDGKEGSEIKLGETPALLNVFTAKVTETTYKFAQIITVRRGMAYIVTYTGLPDDYDKYYEDFETVINSFRFK